MKFSEYTYYEVLNNKITTYKRRYRGSCSKTALKLILWNFKSLITFPNKLPKFDDEKQHIMLKLAGGVGDLCATAKYIKALYEYLDKQAEFDIFAVPEDVEILTTIFYGCEYINSITSQKPMYRYDIEIFIVRFPEVRSCIRSRLSDKALRYIEEVIDFTYENTDVVKNDFVGCCFSLIKGTKRENQADFNNMLKMENVDFSINLCEDSGTYLHKLKLSEKQYITVQTGPGRHFQHLGFDVRQWPEEYYEHLLYLLKQKYPDYKIVQLGDINQQKIAGIDIDLRGKTSSQELFMLLKYSKLHIAQESGMVIARHFLQGGVSVVLFGPTDMNFFGFDENLNLSESLCGQPCEWITKKWMEKCIRTGGKAECMQLLTPINVFDEVNKKGIL